jgi:predicted TIM-barrel fold metal-dependent hydrolase
MDRYVVISSDCHAGADVLDYKPYLERRWHDEFDAWAASYNDPWAEIEGSGPPGRRAGVASSQLSENWDSDLHLNDLEDDGVVGEVLFPNTTPPFYPGTVFTAPGPETQSEYEHRWAGLQAHNRWLVDFCALVPGRRAGVAQVFLDDLDDTLNTLEWIKKVGLTGGILLPGISPSSKTDPLYAPRYERVWAACQDLEIPINQHTGTTGAPTNHTSGAVAGAVRIIENRFFTYRNVWHLIFAGVFERYPRLKYVMTEVMTGWAAERLNSLDWVYRQAKTPATAYRVFAGDAVDNLPLSPSEYFARNCYLGSSLLMREEAELRYEIGVDRIMWGQDYPHSEGSFPFSKKALQVNFAGVPADEVRMMVGGTAAHVYGFDLEQLQPIANRVGPTVEEVATPLAEFPKQPDETSAAIFGTKNLKSVP